jgi:hypothetical protein
MSFERGIGIDMHTAGNSPFLALSKRADIHDRDGMSLV